MLKFGAVNLTTDLDLQQHFRSGLDDACFSEPVGPRNNIVPMGVRRIHPGKKYLIQNRSCVARRAPWQRCVL